MVVHKAEKEKKKLEKQTYAMRKLMESQSATIDSVTHAYSVLEQKYESILDELKKFYDPGNAMNLRGMLAEKEQELQLEREANTRHFRLFDLLFTDWKRYLGFLRLKDDLTTS